MKVVNIIIFPFACLLMFVVINCGKGIERSFPEESKITVFYDGDEWSFNANLN